MCTGGQSLPATGPARCAASGNTRPAPGCPPPSAACHRATSPQDPGTDTCARRRAGTGLVCSG